MASPIILSTWSFSQRGADRAWPALSAGGSSVDAVELVATDAERDVTVDSVGYGGLPDAAGAVTLDASFMLSPDRCGSVAVVARHRDAASLARAVMERSPHVMIAGSGADAFADSIGLREEGMVAPDARERWERWRRDGDGIEVSRDRSLQPRDDGAGGPLFADRAETPTSGEREPPAHDTMTALALDAAGVLAGVSTTSGMAFKPPGRVGDSPILGHGLYVHPGVGGAGATGHGELAMGSCTAFLTVEEMRRGASPRDAIHAALRRIVEEHDVRADEAEGRQIAIIAMRPDGTWATGAVRGGFRAVVVDGAGSGDGARVVAPDVEIFPDRP